MASELDPAWVPLVLDRASSGKESITLGLIRALLTLLTGGLFTTPREVTAQMNTVTRIAETSMRGVSWSMLDAVSETSTRFDMTPAVDRWHEAQVDRYLREMQVDVDRIAQEIEHEARDALAEANMDALHAHSAAAPASNPVIGYRRVPHPELSKGGTCGLCIAASDRMYRNIYTEKIHDGCKCEVVEIHRNGDPGLALNSMDLGSIYSAADLSKGGYGDRSALSNVRVQYDQAGDLVVTKTRKARSSEPDEVTVSAANQQAVADLFSSINAAYRKAS